MKVTPFIIERFAKFVIGGVPFESMKRIVADWDNEALTGEEKRKAVLHEFATLGYAIASWLVNLGIELAVAYLRKKEA